MLFLMNVNVMQCLTSCSIEQSKIWFILLHILCLYSLYKGWYQLQFFKKKKINFISLHQKSNSIKDYNHVFDNLCIEIIAHVHVDFFFVGISVYARMHFDPNAFCSLSYSCL